MKRFLRIFFFLCLLQIGQISVVVATQEDSDADAVIAESVLETDGYSSERYSDFDLPCGSPAVNVPSPTFSPAERGGGQYNGNSRRVRSFTPAHYVLFRYDRLLNRHSTGEFGKLLSCQLSGVLSQENHLFFLCVLKS
jgi:hypothetical protein